MDYENGMDVSVWSAARSGLVGEASGRQGDLGVLKKSCNDLTGTANQQFF